MRLSQIIKMACLDFQAAGNYLLGWWNKQYTLFSIIKCLQDMLAQAYSQCCQTSKMEIFVKIISNFQPLKIFAKNPILDI